MYNRAAYQKWYHKHPQVQIQRNKKYLESKKGKLAHKKTAKKYSQTEKGRIVNKRTLAKRKRNLDWIPLYENPFGDSEKVEWHHINNIYVVAIPKDLHQLYYGKYHRENEMRIIEQIYGG